MKNIEPAVCLVSVNKQYTGAGKPIQALSSVNLAVYPGEHLAIVGPSGSGKSSLLAIVGCLDQPDAGVYRFFGQDVTRLSAKESAILRNKNIGFVFQSLSLLPNLDVFSNVALPFDYSSKSDADVTLAVSDALRKVGMLSFSRRMPRELSGGQQQRVAIARAIVMNPKLLVADEPTGALDQISAHQIMDSIVNLRRSGQTVITVTHDVSIARRADRVLSFRDGRFEL